MQRRAFLKQSGVIVGGAALTPLAARAAETVNWKMVTAWPKNFPGLGTGANRLAELIGQLSGGRL
ncbi:MAG: twin-arginine translocation signal domain-containing protein, partial [Methylococcales bacterium]|nr:twin-arginine translocation signal domain-containing protein [Methylococcales bacterium]